MTVRPLAVLVVALATIVTGCGDAFSPEGVAGTYRLVSIWGHPLPHSLILDTYCEPTGRVSPATFTYQSGSLTLAREQTFVYEHDWTLTGECNVDESGTWTSAGPYTLTAPSTISLSGEEVIPWEGTVTGDRITIVSPSGMVFER